MVYHEDTIQKCLVYISKSYYPPKAEIESGVKVNLIHLERKNLNAKVINSAYKDEVNRKIKESNSFEALLVDSDGNITEGSRSNVFFIIDHKAYTSSGEYVLKGITRQYIFEACKKAGVQVGEALICTGDLKNIEGLFISGTSIKVLPVSQVDETRYNSSTHPLIVSIRDQYDMIIEEYLKKPSV